MDSIHYGPARLRPAKRQRASSYDQTGGNCDHWRLHPGEERILMETAGPGCIRHIWFTIGSDDPMHLRNIVLRAYWDGQDTPSIFCPIGDFFGQGHGVYSLFETPWLSASSKNGRALNCFFPMPFAHGARITVQHQVESGTPAYFYFYIDYETGELPPEDVGRFHAHWRRECLTRPETDLANRTGEGNFLVADIQGRGQYVGTVLYIDSPSPFWNGEGDDMFFIDAEPWPPRLHGTGTEDYFNTAWCPREKWSGIHQGLILAAYPHGQPFLGKCGFYRFHTADPVQFQKSLRFSIEHGTGNEFVGDWAATSFWYQLDRTTPLAELPPPAQRMPLPALAVDAGTAVEQSHKCLSYFYQAGAAEAGDRLIHSLESQWRAGQFDAPAARQWAADLWEALRPVRQSYLQQTGRIAHLPDLSRKGAVAAELVVDRIHGSHLAAPRAGRMWLGYDDEHLRVSGRFDIARRERPGYCYDRIDLMLAPEEWPEAFLMLSASPDRTHLLVQMHHANGQKPWDEMAVILPGEIPIQIEVASGDWRFEYKVPWTALGLPPPRPGMQFALNIDRWNQVDSAWWASWAITPHHYYPPQIGGVAVLAE